VIEAGRRHPVRKALEVRGQIGLDRAADLLGLNRNTLRKKIRDLDIQVYRSGG